MATIAFVLFWVVLGLAVVLAAMRSGRRAPLLNPATRGGRRTLALLTAAVTAVFLVAIPLAVGLSGDDNQAQAGAVQLTAAEREGRSTFYRACGQCHALDAANAVGRVGPDLDVLRPPKELVLDAIDKGRARGQGQMPAQVVEGEEAENVAAFVAKTAGR
jgi:mono/diheme cytochrome c family protein